MANFDLSYVNTMGNEGGYVNNPNDDGGETYRGVARVMHPNWLGWKIIDSLHDTNFPICLNQHIGLQTLVKEFYRANFWNAVAGDAISDQTIGEELFDTAVLMGPHNAIIFLQTALNLLNNSYDPQRMLYSDLEIDGKIGPTTLAAVNKIISKGGKDILALYKWMNILQGAYLAERIKKSPKNEMFARGWLERITIEKV